jgi:hypothetical protein
MSKHLTEDATIRGALLELIEGNGLFEVVMTLDYILQHQEHEDPHDDIPYPMQVDLSFPRRRSLAEEGDLGPPQLVIHDN